MAESYKKASVRKDVWDQSNGRCHYCGKELHPITGFHVDHVIPRCKGGTDDLENLVASCPTCNMSKGGRPVNQWMREPLKDGKNNKVIENDINELRSLVATLQHRIEEENERHADSRVRLAVVESLTGKLTNDISHDRARLNKAFVDYNAWIQRLQDDDKELYYDDFGIFFSLLFIIVGSWVGDGLFDQWGGLIGSIASLVMVIVFCEGRHRLKQFKKASQKVAA